MSTRYSRRSIARRGRIAILCVGSILCWVCTVQAQGFISGSTGANGALDYSGLPNGSTVIFDPTKLSPPAPPGTNVFNFTTINVPSGVTVKLRGDMINGPIYWLAQGN